ncbi:Uncharacterised protein [Shigella sonnei]|nr:Uncharacterised protein [Shigella sonnei]
MLHFVLGLFPIRNKALQEEDVRNMFKEEVRFAKKQIGQLDLVAKRLQELNAQWEANIGVSNPGYTTLSGNIAQIQKAMHEQIGTWNRNG